MQSIIDKPEDSLLKIPSDLAASMNKSGWPSMLSLLMAHAEITKLTNFILERFPDKRKNGVNEMTSDIVIRLLQERFTMSRNLFDKEIKCVKCGKYMIAGYGFDFDPVECRDCTPGVWEQYIEKLKSLPIEQRETLATHGRGLSWLIGTTYTKFPPEESQQNLTTPAKNHSGEKREWDLYNELVLKFEKTQRERKHIYLDFLRGLDNAGLQREYEMEFGK